MRAFQVRLFLDTGDPATVKQYMHDFPYLGGVTTTPVLMRTAGVDPIEGYLEMLEHCDELHVEAMGDTAEEIVLDARNTRISLLARKDFDPAELVFKIPVSVQGLKACDMLTSSTTPSNMRVNMHLVYTPQQAILASQAGADYICACAGKFEDQGYESETLFARLRESGSTCWESDLMFSSVRFPFHVFQAAKWGVDVCTIPPSVLLKLADNDLTRRGTEEFRLAYDLAVL